MKKHCDRNTSIIKCIRFNYIEKKKNYFNNCEFLLYSKQETSDSKTPVSNTMKESRMSADSYSKCKLGFWIQMIIISRAEQRPVNCIIIRTIRRLQRDVENSIWFFLVARVLYNVIIQWRRLIVPYEHATQFEKGRLMAYLKGFYRAIADGTRRNDACVDERDTRERDGLEIRQRTM